MFILFFYFVFGTLLYQLFPSLVAVRAHYTVVNDTSNEAVLLLGLAHGACKDFGEGDEIFASHFYYRIYIFFKKKNLKSGSEPERE